MHAPRFQNNFDLIRFIAACMVILAHSNFLLKPSATDLLASSFNIGMFFPEVGVAIFFVISGYLITKSLQRSPNIGEYVWKRGMRIFPGLCFALLFAVFFVGPLTTEVSFWEYFSSAETYKHLASISLYKLHLHIDTVFESFECRTVNGSLWTLAYEFSFYLLILLLWPIKKAKNMTALLLGVYFIAALGIRFYLGDKIHVYAYSSPWVFGLGLASFFNLSIFFISGALFLYIEPFLRKHSAVFASLAIFINAACLYFHQLHILPFLLIPSLVFLLAFIPGKTNYFGKSGDYSYGMYIYHYPVQQCIIYFFGNSMGLIPHFILTLALCFPLAFMSWHWIEKSALAIPFPKFLLKNKHSLPSA